MNMIFVFLLLLTLLPDLYIWLSFVRGSSLVFSVLHWLPAATVLALTVVFLCNRSSSVLQVMFVVVACLTFPKLFFTVVSLAGRGLSVFLPQAFGVGNIIAAAVLAISFAAATYGCTAGWRRMQTNEQTFTFGTLPENFNGYRIVQISDLHLGTNGKDTRYVERMVDSINSAKPDMVVFTGDIINNDISEIQPFTDILSRIEAPDGTFSVLGNHDYFIYGDPRTRKQNLEKLISAERGMGWNVLLNESRFIRRGTDSIAIAGVEYIGKFTSHHGNLRKAMVGVNPEHFTILLSHDPWHWRNEVVPETDIELTLSGHTHAAQLRIGCFSPAQWLFQDWAGVCRDKNQILNVSVGAGGTIPFRLGAWPEINIITLNK